MFRYTLKFPLFLVFCLVLNMTLATLCFAQNAGGGGDIDELVADTKNDLLVVVGGGLAGAILGLSTLSFVEEPKEHTRNIIVGASIGIIAGVGYVAFSQATKSQEMIYGMEGEGASVDFNTHERRGWHMANNSFTPISSPYQVGLSFKY